MASGAFSLHGLTPATASTESLFLRRRSASQPSASTATTAGVDARLPGSIVSAVLRGRVRLTTPAVPDQRVLESAALTRRMQTLHVSSTPTCHSSWRAVSHFALTTRSMVSPMRAVL